MCATCWKWIQSLAYVRYAIHCRGYYQLKMVFWYIYLFTCYFQDMVLTEWLSEAVASVSLAALKL